MANTEIIKTNFSAGEIAPELMGRSDLRLYQNGAKTLENVFVQPTGGITRRHGLLYLDTLPVNDGRMVPFEKDGEAYLLLVMYGGMTVYKDDQYVATVYTPWTLDQVHQVAWVQSNDELLLVHPDVSPRKLTFDGTTWTLSEWVYDSETTGRTYQPFHKFVKNTTIAASGTTGSITLTASASLFKSSHVNARFRLNNKEVKITAVASGTSATATVYETLTGTAATSDWKESAFSNARGWPRNVAFHQDRLVIGGSRDMPNRLFMSKTGLMWNFDMGTGLDDEAIEFAILSDQQNDIQGMFSSRHLLIFTSGGEWMATGSPMTPGTLQVQRQSRIGSRADYFVPLQDADGATYFISRNGRQLCEMFYNDVDGAYNATDLAATARHMVVDAIDQTYDPKNRLIHVVLADGTMSTLTVYRTEGVNAWSRQITDGQFKAVSTIGEQVFVIVQRNEGLFLERFEKDIYLDAARVIDADSPVTSWSAFSHMPSREVSVILDDVVRENTMIAGGVLTTDIAGQILQAGIGFTSRIAPLPPSQVNFAGASAMRLIEMTLRLFETASLKIDTGMGARDIPLSGLDMPPPHTYLPRLTKDISVRSYGWSRDTTQPLWSIVQDMPQPFTLLSVTASMKVSS